MRVHIKGGAWKNTEDEILKAAVMKYGKYQWGRIASLMNKKSPKQCKARWYEWLDPSIKKTEWSREEDEKLLHAAKVMPCQWRSIAAMVGRTAAQCLDRYEKLLDAATLGTGAATDDPRKLRIGEVDPNPESKPALPDAVDMEEDEKEMLQEARARMANTSGKKVKRKAREKQLEQARMLAVMQRKREMKAAGLQVSTGTGKRKKDKGPDYNREIPYYHAPVAGFHDGNEELAKPPPPVDFKSMTAKARAGMVNKEELEEKKRKKDTQKQKEEMEKDPIKALEELNKAAEARRAALRRASHLTLPSAELTDEDRKRLSRMTYDPDLEESMQSGSDATKQLLAYAATPQVSSSSTSNAQSTPITRKQDHIMMEAANQAKLRSMQTPLLGGDNIMLQDSGFRSGAWKDALSTPNPLATPLLKSKDPVSSSFSTPAAGQTASMGPPKSMPPPKAPNRDQLGLNTPMTSAASTPAIQYSDFRSQQAAQVSRLKSGFSALPAPKHVEFAVSLDDIESMENVSTSTRRNANGPMDAMDIERSAAAEQQRKQAEHLRSRSTAAKRGLVRPSSISPSLNNSNRSVTHQKSKLNLESVAADMIQQEVASVLINDLVHFPAPGTSPMPKPDPSWSYDLFSEVELGRAKLMLQEEVESLQQAHPYSFEQFKRCWEQNLPTSLGLQHAPTHSKSPATKPAQSQMEALKRELAQVQMANSNLIKKMAPIEKKLGVYSVGLTTRADSMINEIAALLASSTELTIDLAEFQAQLENENKILPQRLNDAQQAVIKVNQREKELQSQYESLKTRQSDMRE